MHYLGNFEFEKCGLEFIINFNIFQVVIQTILDGIDPFLE